ncbi:MAG: homoserine kinase, partial [Gemmatimonadaceae bacterium]
MRRPHRAGALAPPSIGNFGPGLDVLGCAIEGSPDIVIAELHGTDGRITVVESGHPELPTDPELHASAIAASSVLREIESLGISAAVGIPGIALRVRKGLPLAAGQGGSAASAVAGAVAVNALLGAPLSEMALLRCALEAEARVAGRHLDNVAPALLGGFVLIRSQHPIDVVRLPTPGSLRIVLADPQQRLRTADARAVLPERVDRAVALHQAAQVATIVAALYAGD